VNTFVVDTTAPTLSQVTAVTTPTKDTTPGYAFSSDEAGTVSYGGSCSSGTSSASSGTNSISFSTLSEASYSNCTINVTDNASNISSTLPVSSFTIDTTASTVTSVSSSNTNGAYNENDNVTITITFSENVIVDNSSGNPRIQLETGTNDRYANYISGNSTSILSFLYTAQSGDNSSVLDYKATDSLSANSGNIRDNASNDATLTLPSPGASGSLGANKSVVIDTTAPTVSSTSHNDNQSSVSVSNNISLTFSEIMDNSSITTNTDNTSCYGSFQVSSDNFSTCVQMSSSPSISNSAKTFTVDPSDNLSYAKEYIIKLTTGTKDTNGVFLESPYETSFNTLGVFIAAVGKIKISLDGVNWYEFGGCGVRYGVAYGNGIAVAVGLGSCFDSTSDLTISPEVAGTHWNSVTTNPGYGWSDRKDFSDITYGNKLFVAVGQSGVIYTSSDGSTWEKVDSGTTQWLNGVHYANGLFVAVGEQGTIRTSSDGITWTSRDVSVSVGFKDITYGNQQFIAVGAYSGSSYFYKSSDGITWASTSSAAETKTWGNNVVSYLYRSGISYSEGRFLLTANIGTLKTSTDGSSWSSLNTGEVSVGSNVNVQQFEKAISNNGTIVVVGANRNIVSTDNGSTWAEQSWTATHGYDVIFAE
jgi:hypothetical protein